MIYKILEVNAGCCTGTLRGNVIEANINAMARQGWKFEQMDTIIGRDCLIFERYKAVICFSKETESSNKNTTISQSENSISTHSEENWICKNCSHSNPVGVRLCEKCGR